MQIFSQEFINYIFEFWNQYKYFFYFICVILFFISLLFLISLCIFISYLILKFFSFNLNVKYYSSNDYPKNTKEMIHNYSDYKINKIILNEYNLIYCSKLIDILPGIFFHKKLEFYNKFYNSLKLKHYYFIFEIEKENTIRYLIIEKNLTIRISDKFIINNNEIVECISVSDKSLTINDLFKQLEKNVGKELHSWNPSNNCSNFIEYVYNIFECPIPSILIHNKNFVNFLLFDSELPKYYSDTIIMLLCIFNLFLNKLSYYFTLSNRLNPT